MRSFIDFLNKRENSLRKQSYLLFASKVAAFGLNFVVPVLLVRLFTKEDYGLYRFSFVISSTVVATLTLGLSTSLYYFFPNSEEHRAQLLGQTLFFLIVISTFGLLIYFLIIRRFLAPIPLNIDLPIALATFLLLISTPSEHLFILEKKAILNGVFLISEQIIRTFCVLLPALFFKNIYYVLWSLVAYGGIRFIFYFIYVGVKYQMFWKLTDKAYIYAQLRYSIPFGIGNAIVSIGKRVDRLIVPWMAGLDNFALYSVASTHVPFLVMFMQSIFQVTAPKLAIYSSADNATASIKLWHQTVIKAALVVIPSFVFLQVAAEKIVEVLYTSSYIASAPSLRIFALMLLIQMTGYGLVSRAYDKTRIFLYASFCSLISGASLGFTLTKYFGIIGASISAVSALGVYAGIILYAEKNILNLSLSNLLPFRKVFSISLISCTCALPLLLLGILIHDPLIALILYSLAYATSISIAYLATDMISLPARFLDGFLRKPI